MRAEVSAATGPHHTPNHQLSMGLCCPLRSVLQQDPITPHLKRPTCDGAPLHTEVRAVTRPLCLSPAKRPFRPIRRVVSLLLLTLMCLHVCSSSSWFTEQGPRLPRSCQHGDIQVARFSDLGLQTHKQRLCTAQIISNKQISQVAEALEAAGPSQCTELKREATSRDAGSEARIACGPC